MPEIDNSNNKILWVNGLRGLACLMVFFHHYALSFYKGVYYGLHEASLTRTHIDVLLGYKPYGAIINGNYAVCLFITLSAFLYARKTMLLQKEGKTEDLFLMGIKRYFRLMPSVFIVGLVYYFLRKLEVVLSINYFGDASSLNIFELLYHIFVLQWVTGDTEVVGPFWCMYILFLGSFIAVILAKLTNKRRWYMPIVYIILAMALSKLNACYAAVGFGALIADVVCYDRLKQWMDALKININVRVSSAVIGILFIIIGVYLGGYPSYQESENVIYIALRFISNKDITVAHSIAALFTVLGIAILPKTRILSGKVFGFIGDISFAVFIIHEIVIELLSYLLVDKLTVVTGNYHMAFWISMAITIVIVFALSVFYHYLIENNINKLVLKTIGRFSKE